MREAASLVTALDFALNSRATGFLPVNPHRTALWHKALAAADGLGMMCAWMPPSRWTGTLWEVPVHLRGRREQLPYEPFQWSVLEVWYQDKFAGLGRRCDKQLNAKTYNSTDYER